MRCVNDGGEEPCLPLVAGEQQAELGELPGSGIMLKNVLRAPAAKVFVDLKPTYGWMGALPCTQCLKITEKASKSEACSQTVLPDRSILIGQKIGEKCQN